MKTRIPDNIGDLAHKLISYSPMRSEKLGRASIVFFNKNTEQKTPALSDKKHHFVKTSIDYESPPVYSMLHSTRLIEKQEDKKHSPIDMTFLETSFYFSNKETVIDASTNLYDYMSENAGKKYNIEEIITQIILAVHELHSHNLVHRDIRLEHIKVTPLDSYHVKIKLGGLHLVTSADTKDVPIISSPYYLPKEICKSSWGELESTNELDPMLYQEADKKAIDCYAVGLVIHFILKFYTHLKARQLRHLSEGLIHENPLRRTTMLAALQHEALGYSNQKREDNFNEIKWRGHQIEFFSDGYYIPPQFIPQKNDAFLVLSASIKEIYLLAVELQLQIDFIKNIDGILHKDFVQIESYSINPTTLNAVKNKATVLQDKTNNYLKHFYPLQTVKNIHQQAYDVIQAINELAHLYLGYISTDQLILAADQALKHYIRINKLTTQDLNKSLIRVIYTRLWHIKHGLSGKINAVYFVNSLKKAKESSSPGELFDIILNHLKNGPGNHNPNSFKTFMVKELQFISKLPFEQWKKSLVRVKPDSVDKPSVKMGL